MVEITVPGHELVVTFSRDGVVADCFYCTDGKLAYKLALVILMTSGEELQEGDMLSVEPRRRPGIVVRGAGLTMTLSELITGTVRRASRRGNSTSMR